MRDVEEHKFYGRWLAKDVWTLAEADMLLRGLNPKFGSPMEEDAEDARLKENASKGDIIDLVRRSYWAQKIEIPGNPKVIDSSTPIEPLVFLKWAAKKNFIIPRALLVNTSYALNNPSQKPALNCSKWLENKVLEGSKQKSKNAYYEEARETFKVSRNAFNKAWQKATLNTNWIKAGPIKKS